MNFSVGLSCQSPWARMGRLARIRRQPARAAGYPLLSAFQSKGVPQ
jgi:hypothetical protein